MCEILRIYGRIGTEFGELFMMVESEVRENLGILEAKDIANALIGLVGAPKGYGKGVGRLMVELEILIESRVELFSLE